MEKNPANIQNDNFLYWPLDVLAYYIQKKQQKIMKMQKPLILEQFAMVCAKHGKFHPEIRDVSGFFNDLNAQFQKSMDKDTTLIFPYILDLVRSHHRHVPITAPKFSSMSNIHKTEYQNHQAIATGLAGIVELTSTFNRFTSVNSEYDLLVNALKMMADEFNSIGRLKFDILFPRAMEAENTVNWGGFHKENLLQTQHYAK
jgi:regulator of cell morphogenesis and NO signaling